MNRDILLSKSFVRAAKRIRKKNAAFAEELESTLEMLAEDAFDPRLKTHKLKGDLAGIWACSVGYDLRILFEFTEHEGSEVILLLTIGTHDEVY